MHAQTHVNEAKKITLAEAIEYLEEVNKWVLDGIQILSNELEIPHDQRMYDNMEEGIEGYRYEHQCLTTVLTKLKEEEYAAKMLNGAHARMELARQMNEQGEL